MARERDLSSKLVRFCTLLGIETIEQVGFSDTRKFVEEGVDDVELGQRPMTVL
jgi:hypothetical protein